MKYLKHSKEGKSNISHSDTGGSVLPLDGDSGSHLLCPLPKGAHSPVSLEVQVLPLHLGRWGPRPRSHTSGVLCFGKTCSFFSKSPSGPGADRMLVIPGEALGW